MHTRRGRLSVPATCPSLGPEPHSKPISDRPYGIRLSRLAVVVQIIPWFPPPGPPQFGLRSLPLLTYMASSNT